MNTKRLTFLAVLTAAALGIFIIEAQIPPLAPIPGIKLGLANVITLWALYALGARDAGLVLAARILLGALFAGSATALLYSAAGGALCFGLQLLLKRAAGEKNIWALGVLGAVAHNAGQLVCAAAVTGSAAVFAYAPVLTASACATGLFTGLIANTLYTKLKDTRIMRGL